MTLPRVSALFVIAAITLVTASAYFGTGRQPSWLYALPALVFCLWVALRMSKEDRALTKAVWTGVIAAFVWLGFWIERTLYID